MNIGKHASARDPFRTRRTHLTRFFGVNVFSTGDGTPISTWSSKLRKGPAVCSAKEVPSFLSSQLF